MKFDKAFSKLLTWHIASEYNNSPVHGTSHLYHLLLDRQMTYVAGVTGRTYAQETLSIVEVDTGAPVIAWVTCTFVVISATTLLSRNPTSRASTIEED